MIKSILVPLDGSQLGECVLPHTCALARTFNAEINLLHMLEKNQVGASAQLFDLLNWQIKKTQAAVYLEKTRSQLQKSNLRVRVAVLEGLVAAGISEYAQSQGMQLIILSSHGRKGISQWGLGSSTQKIVLSATSSLLIVRAHPYSAHADEAAETPLYQRILVPLDGSQRAEIILPIITQLARFQKSEIHLAQVVQTPEMARQMPATAEDVELSRRVTERNSAEAGRYLQQVKLRSSLQGIQVTTHLVSAGSSAAELHRLVEQEHIDLVALSAHGYSGNLQWPYGSMVNNFIMYGKSSLLIVQDLPSKQEAAALEETLSERGER